MHPLRVNKSPEAKIQLSIKKFLEERGWYVIVTHGNTYQSGVPDLFVTHKVYGGKWIEVKLPEMKGSRFTRAQMVVFPKLISNGTGIWIMTSVSDYDCLFGDSILWHYMGMKH